MITDATQHLAVLTVALHIPHASSLKEKRMVLKSLKERLRRKFNISIAELDGQDKWQVATLGIAIISGGQKYVDQSFEKVLSFIEGSGNVEVCEHETYNY